MTATEAPATYSAAPNDRTEFDFYARRDELYAAVMDKYAPEASDKDRAILIARASINRAPKELIADLHEANKQAQVEEREARAQNADTATNEFWDRVADQIPPYPKNNEHVGLFHSLARPIALDIWRNWDKDEETNEEEGPSYYKLADYARIEFPNEIWRVRNLCETQGVGMIAARDKHGKTALCVEFGLCLASGKPFMDNPILEPAPVLYIEQEGNEKALQQHVITTARARGIDLDETPFYVRHRKQTRIDTEDGIAHLRQLITETGAKVVMIGPLAFLHRQKSEDDSALMAPLMASLNQIATDLGVFIYLIHHARKASGIDTTRKPNSVFAFFEKVRGSSVFIGHVDVAIGLWRSATEPAGTMYVLNRNGADYMVPYDFNTETFVFTHRAIETAEEKAENETERHIRLMVESEEKELTIDSLAALWGISEKTARRKLAIYMTRQLVSSRIEHAHKNRHFYYPTAKGVAFVTTDSWESE